MRRAFHPGGRLLLCVLQNSCTAAVIVLFLGCCLSLNLFLSLNLSHRSALCVGISLSAIDESYFYSMLPRLQHWVPRAISAPPTVLRSIHGRLFKMNKDRAFTLGV